MIDCRGRQSPREPREKRCYFHFWTAYTRFNKELKKCNQELLPPSLTWECFTYIYHLFDMFRDGVRVEAWSHTRPPFGNHRRLHWSYRLERDRRKTVRQTVKLKDHNAHNNEFRFENYCRFKVGGKKTLQRAAQCSAFTPHAQGVRRC